MSLKPDEEIRVVCIVGGEEWLVTVSRNPQDKPVICSQEVHHLLPNKKRSSRESLSRVESRLKGNVND
tara:strand:- start:155 stop:358 length:204 start_codon:yes stop_codon:yes gene_type:complete